MRKLAIGLVIVAAACNPANARQLPSSPLPNPHSVPVVNEDRTETCNLGSGEFRTDYLTAQMNGILSHCKP